MRVCGKEGAGNIGKGGQSGTTREAVDMDLGESDNERLLEAVRYLLSDLVATDSAVRGCLGGAHFNVDICQESFFILGVGGERFDVLGIVLAFVRVLHAPSKVRVELNGFAEYDIPAPALSFVWPLGSFRV